MLRNRADCSRAIIVLASLIAACYATTAGQKFQLVFMENVVEAPRDLPLEVHVSNTENSAARVTVSSPRTDCPSETKTVPANSAVRFDVCWWMRAVAWDYWPAYKTVLVESDRNVMVYGVNRERFSTDGFYAIPTNELAFNYYLAAYDSANLATQFAISVTQDNTSVQVTLPSRNDLPVKISYQGVVYTNGETFLMTLSMYETFIGQSRGDLTGAQVLADKPIAVFSGNIRNKEDSSSRDHLAAQLMPTGDWGLKYALQPVPRTENAGDIVRVIARASNTRFRITFKGGSSQDQTLNNAGDFHEFSLGDACVIASTSSSIEVIQMVRSQKERRISDVADPCMFLSVPQNKWLNEYISPSLRYGVNDSPYTKNFAFFAIREGNEGGLRIDGGSISAQWNRVTTNDNILTAWVAVSSGSHRFTHTSNVNFEVMVYGASDRESYGFALGASMINSACQESLMMRGDLKDNDCDSSIDEEKCDGVDDDNDGRVDEDCSPAIIEAFGNEYVIMFMENNVDDNPNAESLLEIYMSGVSNTDNIQYSLIRQGATRNGTITPNNVVIFDDLPIDLRHQGSGLDNKAIKITASADIVVYGMNKQTWSTDGFLAFPVDVVGTEYYSSHYYPGTDKNEFAFTPVRDDGTATRVTVTMPSNRDSSGNIASTATFGTQTVTAGQSITVDVNYGQTAQFQSASDNDNLNGAHIVATKPIALFSGNVRARVDPTTANSRDHLVQQLTPVATWGKEFVTLPIPRQAERGDLFFITAHLANTRITVDIKNSDGTNLPQQVKVLSNAGSYVSVPIGSQQYGHIVADKAVQVFQYVKTTGDKDRDTADPAMMTIPPVEQWSRNYKFVTPRTGQREGSGFKFFDTFIMVAIQRSERNGLKLDGNNLNNPSWVDLSGSSYSATVINIGGDNNRHTLTHDKDNVFFQALMYGRANRESYALPLGMKLVAQACTQTTMTEGDGLDNDCDGSVDEELCNSVDDDADGKVDEDCGAGISSGTSFYLTYMENTVEYPKDYDLELYVAVVGDQKATVNVRVPLVNFPVYNSKTEVSAGKVQQYGFAYTLRNTGQGVFPNTIYVRANSEVVVYGVNKEKFSSDAFLVYPESSLGIDHYTCSWSPSTLQTEFAVVATQDSTRVDITLPNKNNIQVEANGQRYTGGASFSLTLNRFRVFQAQSSGDLTGTRVRTSHRAAVFSGNVRTLVKLSASRDHLVQQMLPISSYGSEFYIVPYPQRTVGDMLRIVARQSNTEVRVDGNKIGRTINAGEFVEHELNSNSRVTLTSTNPVMVVQFMKSQDGRDNTERADPAMFIVPSNTNFVRTATFITPVYSGGRVPGTDYKNYVTLVTRNGQQSNLRLNNAALSNTLTWSSISSSGFVTATFEVPSGESHTIKSTSDFYGRLYGIADRESYAFPIGFSF